MKGGLVNLKNRITLARESSGLTQKDLASAMGISPSTLNGYEKGNHDPKSDGLAAIATICGVTVDYLLGLSDSPRPQHATNNPAPPQNKNSTPGPYTAEVEVAKYKRLDRHGKQVVCAVISEEEKRMDAEHQRQEPNKIYPINAYLQTASAGCGDFTDDASYDVIDLVKRPPNGTAFIITLNGDSMEPTYHDGDKLFIKSQNDVKVGDIGLFAIGPDIYVKEQGVDCLISHNPKYPSKRPYMDTVVKVYGKVLGVCTDDYFGK